MTRRIQKINRCQIEKSRDDERVWMKIKASPVTSREDLACRLLNRKAVSSLACAEPTASATPPWSEPFFMGEARTAPSETRILEYYVAKPTWWLSPVEACELTWMQTRRHVRVSSTACLPASQPACLLHGTKPLLVYCTVERDENKIKEGKSSRRREAGCNYITSLK